MVQLNKSGPSEPLGWVIAFAETGGKASHHGCSMFDGQAALRYYPSPFDALVDIGRTPDLALAKAGFTVQPVSAFRVAGTTATGHASVIASMHVAWRARSGRVLVRADGTPDAVLSTAPVMESRKTVRELPAPISFLIERIRERAGLFAWRETVQTFSAWDRHSLEALAGQAWRHTPVVEVDGADPDFDQFAVYDPEFQQWHFVSASQVMNDCMTLSC